MKFRGDTSTVERAAGMLHQITGRLGEKGIDLHHLYATAPEDRDRVLVAFASANDDEAVVLLNS